MTSFIPNGARMTNKDRHCKGSTTTDRDRHCEKEARRRSNPPNLGMMQRGGTVYILTNVHNTVLYTGVTSDLLKRLIEHKQKKYEKSFTNKYNIDKLVYYAGFN